MLVNTANTLSVSSTSSMEEIEKTPWMILFSHDSSTVLLFHFTLQYNSSLFSSRFSSNSYFPCSSPRRSFPNLIPPFRVIQFPTRKQWEFDRTRTRNGSRFKPGFHWRFRGMELEIRSSIGSYTRRRRRRRRRGAVDDGCKRFNPVREDWEVHIIIHV